MPRYLRALESSPRLPKYPAMASLSHRQGGSFAVLLTVFPCVFFAATKNEAPTVTFHTSTSEVRVTFFATDQNNRAVENIDKNDFAVVDGDVVIRYFRSLTRSDETALDIVLLADGSESVAPRFRVIASDVLRLVEANAQIPGDEMSVVTFAGLEPSLVCSHNCLATVERRLALVQPAGTTPLFDALVFSARLISSRPIPGMRPVLILFSDGEDTISKASPREALDAVIHSGALLYAVDLGSPGHASRGSGWLQRMAEATGGRFFSPQEGGADTVLQTALEDLRASYVVTYPLPSRAAGFHSLRILPKHNLNLRFHCRRGYFYEEAQP